MMSGEVLVEGGVLHKYLMILKMGDCCACVAFLGLVSLFLISIVISILRRSSSVKNKHVLITGGSSGIGKWCAVEVIKRGANVTLLARDEIKLQAAKHEIETFCLDPQKQKISIRSVDITGDYGSIESVIREAEMELGPVFMLINCAGFAIAARMEDTKIGDVRRLMDVNFFGSYFVTRAIVSSMKSQNSGHIVFTSSQAGLVGVYGYTAYSAAKFALRGLAETLQMEVKPYNIRVTVAFPPDTDTPGFAEEEKSKPLETRLISQTSGLISPDVVAQSIVKDVLKGKFFSTVGLDGKMLSILCSGMSPVSSIFDCIIQTAFIGPMRVVGLLILMNFNRIVVKSHNKKDQNKKAE